MGLFDFLKKQPVKVKVTGSIVESPKISISMVSVNPGSKVYHCEIGGCSKVLTSAIEMTEKKAIALGLRRCKQCDWYEFDRNNHDA